MPRTVHIISLPGVSLHSITATEQQQQQQQQQQQSGSSSSCLEEVAGEEGKRSGLQRQLLPAPAQGGNEVRSSTTTTGTTTTCRSSDELVRLPVRRLVEEECSGGGDFSVDGAASADASAVFLNGKRLLKLDRTLAEYGLPRGVAVAVRSFESGGATTGRLLGGAQTLEQWLEGKYGAVDPTTVTEITGAPEDVTGEWCRPS